MFTFRIPKQISLLKLQIAERKLEINAYVSTHLNCLDAKVTEISKHGFRPCHEPSTLEMKIYREKKNRENFIYS